LQYAGIFAQEKVGDAVFDLFGVNVFESFFYINNKIQIFFRKREK